LTDNARDGAIPLLPGQLVGRNQLLHALDQIVDRAVTIVTAPVGSGKSTLVAQWCRECSPYPVVWFDLRRWPDAAALARVVRSDQGRRADQTVVVLDSVDSPELAAVALDLAEESVRAAARRRLVVVGRCPLPQTVVPLLLGGAAWRLGAADLQLNAPEVAQVVAIASRRGVSVVDPAAVLDRLDGWMSAAVLAGMAHPGGPASADELVEAAAEAVEAYVQTEVLRGVDDDQRRFLIETSCVEELLPALTDAMTGRTDSARIVADLRARGFPLVRGSADRARHLRPVRQALDTVARRQHPDARATALRRAAAWYEAHGMPFEAADCVARLDAWQDVVDVIVRSLPLILERDDIGRLADIVSGAPRDVLRQHVPLALGAAWILRMDGRIAAASDLLTLFNPHFGGRGRMIAELSRASVASWASDMGELVDGADRALRACADLDDDAFDPEVRAGQPWFGEPSTDQFRVLAHGAALLACTYGGMWERAAAHVGDGAPETRVGLPQVRAVELMGIRATFDALSGRSLDAELEAHAALLVAEQAHLVDNRATADASFALGEARRSMLRHAEAEEPLRRARALAEANGRVNLVATAVASEANLAVDRGEPDRATELIDRLRRDHPHRHPPTVAGLVDAAAARALVAAGRFQAAVRTLQGSPTTPAVASARVAAFLGAGDPAAAKATVRDWPAAPTVDSTVRRSLAAAVICDHTGDRGAGGLLRAALDAAAPHRLLQPFIEFGPSAAPLIRRVAVEDAPALHELQRWLGSLGAVATGPRFTAREAMVMSHVAEGRKLREVADAIHLSVNTVRTHVQSAYRKLGVDNRADAIRAWRALEDSRV
jgi:LuxR family maltose regulon positive regulatory protein